MQYGVDVASKRADDLDKLMLRDVTLRIAQGDIPTVLDIGCGAGGQSKRLAVLGADVTAVDIANYFADISRINTELKNVVGSKAVTFIQKDITHRRGPTPTVRYDFIACQRMLHYLPYFEARLLLEKLQTASRGSLYLSVTGATSAIAKEYTALDVPIEQRFAKINASAQETFSISAPLCIYREHEIMSLLKLTGWRVKYSRVSDFGNIKIIASRVLG